MPNEQIVGPFRSDPHAEGAPQREYGLREVLNALRWPVETGGQWRMMPHDFPPWAAVYQQARRWVAAGGFEAMAHDLRAVDALGNLLALTVTAADAQERAQVADLAAAVPAATGQTVTPAADAAAHGMRLEVVEPAEAKRG